MKGVAIERNDFRGAVTASAAIVLAAGEGRRMGGPKALLVVDGKPLVASHVERLREVGCRPIIVVVRASVAAAVRAILSDVPEARVVPADTASMAASLALGLEYVSAEPSQVVVVSPVDTLPVQRATLEALLSAVMAAGVQVATPCHRGRGGHPVVARERLLQVFRRRDPGTLREVIRSAEPRRHRVNVDDPAVGGDLDTPADLAALRPGLLPYFASSGG
jgi:CTP:molybdopterin cytidylyltransferase MocA